MSSKAVESGQAISNSAVPSGQPSPPRKWREVWTGVRRVVAAHPVIGFLCLLFVVRCGFILFSPLDLIADESYYWDWSRRLDYGYYSKPPMIAWINWVSTSLLGSTEFAVRFPAALLGTLGLIWVYQLGARLFSFRVGFYSVILLALTPGQTALSFLMTIDAPFLFCWVAALYCFWMMLQSPVPEGRWCLLTALWLGLGVLSKQTMLAFLPLAGLFLLVSPSRRSLLASPRLWLTAAAGLSFLAPVLYWNHRHDWITLQHTASHFQEHSVTLATRFARFAEFLLGQIGVVSPVLWFVVAGVLVLASLHLRRLTDAERYLLCFSAVPLAGVILLSATRRLEPNWPAACYPAGVILTTAVLLGRSSLSDLYRNRQQRLTWSWKVGLACSLGTYAAITIVPLSPLAGTPVDVTCRLRGWSELARQFEQLREEQIQQTGHTPMIVTTAGRDITSALAFYLPDQPLVPFWSGDNAGVNCQYDLWERPQPAAHPHVLVVAPPQAALPPSLANSAPAWQAVGELTVNLGGGRQRVYQVLKATSRTDEFPSPGSPLPSQTARQSSPTREHDTRRQ